MKLKKKQKCAAVVLVCCILFQTTYYCVVRPNVVYATGAGGVISGGAVAGLGLTGPEVALAVAALFGVAYTVDNADTIYTEMNNCINKVTDGLENQATIISDWWKEAAAGVVDTTSSVWKGVCNWFTGTREQNYNITVGSVCRIKAGEKVNWINYGRGSAYGAADTDCCCIEYWYKQGENSRYYFGRLWTCEKNAWITMHNNGSSVNRSLSYNKDYNLYYYNDRDMLTTASSVSWKDTICKYLPNAYYLGQYGFDFTMTTDNLLSLVKPYLEGMRQVGGINEAIRDGSIDNVVTDVVWPDTIVLNPDAVTNGKLKQILEKVISGEVTWTEYLEKVASGTKVGAKTDAGTFVLDNAGATDVPYEKDATDAPPAADTDTALNDSLADYKTDGLTSLFPFCIPFDLINCIKLMSATGEAPCWEFPFQVPVLGLEDTIKIDLAKWDSVAAVCRSLETLLFIGLLISKTRTLIRG